MKLWRLSDVREDKDKKKLEQALMNKALGYTTQEVVEEYGYSGEDFVLQKRKTSTKSYPPDLSALQLLLGREEGDNEYLNMSDEELEKQKIRLIKKLKEKK